MGRAWRRPPAGTGVPGGVTTPDGRKPLALEGKRWFWVSQEEAGSNAYDVYALLRGADRFGVDAWRASPRAPGPASWPGRRRTGASWPGTAPAPRTSSALPSTPRTRPGRPRCWTSWVRSRTSPLDEGAERRPPRTYATSRTPAWCAWRTSKPWPCCGRRRATQHPVGRGVGGGAVVYVGDTATGVDRLRFEREAPETGGLLHPLPRTAAGAPAPLVRLQRIRRSDRPGRRRTAVALRRPPAAGPGRPRAAWQRLWGGYLSPCAGPWLTRGHPLGHPRRAGGAAGRAPAHRRAAGAPRRGRPGLGHGVTLSREVTLEGAEVRLTDRLADEEAGPPAPRLWPWWCTSSRSRRRMCGSAASDGVRGERGGRRLEMHPAGAAFFLRVAYAV